MGNLSKEEVIKFKNIVSRIEAGDILDYGESYDEKFNRLMSNFDYYSNNYIIIDEKMYSFDREFIGDVFSIKFEEW